MNRRVWMSVTGLIIVCGVVLSAQDKQAPPLKQVTGNPYCADTEQETVRTLANGTTLRSIEKGKQCRDSAGRNYSMDEFSPLVANAPTVRQARIVDPLTGESIQLDLRLKMAFVAPTHSRGRVLPPASATPGSAESAVFVPPKGTALRFPLGAATATDPALLPLRHDEDLGEKEIEGVIAHGHRITTTYPTGSRGNDAPLKESYERWQSADLAVIVFEITETDEYGTSTFRLKNISRVEPDPAIFQVPPDYTVEKR